jgi:hypothetical protein
MRAALPVADSRPSRRTRLYLVVLAALLAGSAYLLGLSWPGLFPPPVFSASAAADCDLRVAACMASFDKGRSIRLDIEPKGLPPSAPLRARVNIDGLEADTVTIEFSGVDMNMGLIRNELTEVNDDLFAGDTILPVCIRRRMTWRATVTARGPEGIHKATFDFEIRRP